MRVTTRMMINGYQTNLTKATENKMNYQNKVLTQRNFTSVKEDPSAAAKASRLTRQYLKNEDYLEVSKDLQSKLDSQEASVYQIVQYAEELYTNIGEASLNGTNLAQRETYAETIKNIRDSIVQSLNATYGSTYVLAGSDAASDSENTPPFQLNDNGMLTYRGIEVNSASIDNLEKLTNEDPLYVDIGLGLTFEGNEIVSSSAFDISFPGLKVIWNREQGNGNVDATDGELANNLVDLCTQLYNALTVENDADFDYQFCESAFAEIKNIHGSYATSGLSEIGVQSDFLSKSVERMESNELSLATQLEEVVTPDMAIAITNYSYAQYAYNAALRIGTNLLSMSLLDFMS